MEDIYIRLAGHLENLIMGYPMSDAVLDLLKESFTPLEAQVALSIPNDLMPMEVVDLDTIAARSSLSREIVSDALDSLAQRNMLFTAPTRAGTAGYALLQVGYGMPQSYFWGGVQDERAHRMAGLVRKYFTISTTQKVYGGVATKAFKYSPAGLTVEVPMPGVLPHEQIGPIVDAATKIAVAHCPCRTASRILGRTDCSHSLEVCLKYDELAEFVISRGIAREISSDEARQILADCEREGLVHMVDNVQGEVKHTCNCCGHYCWNVGIIKRRKIPRDVLMAVYFIRTTEHDACVGCGACVEMCPVQAVQLVDGKAAIDREWCIGCGVCAVICPSDAIAIERRIEAESPEDFKELHRRIQRERSTQAG